MVQGFVSICSPSSGTLAWGGRGKQRLTDSLNSSGTCLLVHVSALLNTAPSGTEGLWWWGRCWCSIFMITFSLMRWLMWLIYWLINLDPDQFLWMAVCSPPECVFYVYSFLFFSSSVFFPSCCLDRLQRLCLIQIFYLPWQHGIDVSHVSRRVVGAVRGKQLQS